MLVGRAKEVNPSEIDPSKFVIAGLPRGTFLPRPREGSKCWVENPSERRAIPVGQLIDLINKGYELIRINDVLPYPISPEGIFLRCIGDHVVVAQRNIRHTWRFTVIDLPRFREALQEPDDDDVIRWPDLQQRPAFFSAQSFLNRQEEKGQVLEVANNDEFVRFFGWDGYAHSLALT